MSYARSPRAVCSTTIGTRFSARSFMNSPSLPSPPSGAGGATLQYLIRHRAATSTQLGSLAGRSAGPISRASGTGCHGPTKPGQLAEGHRPVGDLRAPEHPVDDLILEHGGLDLTHRIGVLQVGTSHFVRIRVRGDEIRETHLHALTIDLQVLGT